jgi:hypothetical protein
MKLLDGDTLISRVKSTNWDGCVPSYLSTWFTMLKFTNLEYIIEHCWHTQPLIAQTFSSYK